LEEKLLHTGTNKTISHHTHTDG